MADGYSGPRPTKIHRDEVELWHDHVEVGQSADEVVENQHRGEKMEEVRSPDRGVQLEEQIEGD